MAILRNNKLQAPPPPPSKEVLLKDAIDKVHDISLEAFNTIVNSQRRGVDVVWYNDGYTAQEVFDALGEKGPKIVEYWQALTNFIVEIAAFEGVSVDLKYPTNAFSLSGSKVVVSEDPYEIQ